MTEKAELRQAVQALEYEFSELFGRVRRLIADRAEKLHPGLQPGSYKLFTAIAAKQPVTLSQLVDSLEIDKGQLSRGISELEKAGLIMRDPDPADRRSMLISLTANGKSRLDKVRNSNESPLLAVVMDWEIADIEQLTHLLRKLIDPLT